MPNNGSHEMLENDTPGPASNVGQRRISLDSSGGMNVTDYLGVTTPLVGGASVIVPTILTDADNGITLAVGKFYITANASPLTVYLPAATTTAGDIYLIASLVTVVTVLPQPADLVGNIDGGNPFTPTDSPVLPPFVQYLYRSFGTLLGPSAWFRNQVSSPSRMDVDVEFVTIEPLPASTSNGNSAAERFTANVNGPLIIDASGVSGGQRIAVIFSGPSGMPVGIYLVIDAGSGGTPWIIERQVGAFDNVFALSTARVRVVNGAYGHDREFFVGARTREVSAPLLFGPLITGLITQTTWPGKTDKLDPSGGLITLNLYSDPTTPAVQDGMRYGVKGVVAGAAVTVVTTAPATIEDPNTGVLAASSTFGLGLGAIVYWQYDAVGDVWRLVT